MCIVRYINRNRVILTDNMILFNDD